MMELLEFARGPALIFSITVFIAGVIFRLVSLFAMWRTKDSSEGSPREQSAFVAAPAQGRLRFCRRRSATVRMR